METNSEYPPPVRQIEIDGVGEVYLPATDAPAEYINSLTRLRRGKERKTHSLSTEGRELVEQNWQALCGEVNAETDFDAVREKIATLKKEVGQYRTPTAEHKRFNSLMFRSLEAKVRHHEELRTTEEIKASPLVWADVFDRAVAANPNRSQAFKESVVTKRIQKIKREVREFVEGQTQDRSKRGFLVASLEGNVAALIRRETLDFESNIPADKLQEIVAEQLQKNDHENLESFLASKMEHHEEEWNERHQITAYDIQPVQPQSRLSRNLKRAGSAVAGAAAGVMLWLALKGDGKPAEPPQDFSTPEGTSVLVMPSPTHTETASPTFTVTPSPTSTSTPVPPTETSTATATATSTVTEMPTESPTPTFTPSSTATTTATSTATETPTLTPTETEWPTLAPTESPPSFVDYVPTSPAAEYFINRSDNHRYGFGGTGQLNEFTIHDADSSPRVRNAFSVGPTSRLAQDVVALYNPEIADPKDIISSFPIVTSPELDRYMQNERKGSTGTTPLVLYGPNDIRVESIAFETTALNTDQISESLAVEEFAQAHQYNDFLRVFYNDPEVALEVGFANPEDVAEALTNGSARAFLELVQQKYKYDNSVHENSYHMNVGGFVANENGSPTSRATVDGSFEHLAGFIESFTGVQYTARELMLADNLLDINKQFKEAYPNLSGANIWDVSGLSRQSLQIEPVVLINESVDGYTASFNPTALQVAQN